MRDQGGIEDANDMLKWVKECQWVGLTGEQKRPSIRQTKGSSMVKEEPSEPQVGYEVGRKCQNVKSMHKNEGQEGANTQQSRSMRYGGGTH